MYNAELYIENTINSVLNQSYENFELLIVDDGSTDTSASICELLSQKDKRIHVIKQKNGGVSAARNCGIANANGDWLLFIDADDYINNDYIYNFIPYLSEDSLLQYYGCNIININKTQELYHFEYLEKQSNPMVFQKLYENVLLYSTVWCKVFYKQIIIDNNIIFNESIHNGEDRLFVSDYLLSPEVKSIIIIPQIGYNYILHNDSITHSRIDIESYCLSNVYHFNQLKLLFSKFLVSDNEFISRNMSILKRKLYDGLLLLIRSNIREEKKKQIYSEMHNCFKQLVSYHTNKKLDFIFKIFPFNVGITMIKLIDKSK